MVAERRERKAAPTSWVQPEPAGKGKAVSRKKASSSSSSSSKKKQSAQSSKSVSSAAAAAAAVVASGPVSSHVVQEQEDGSSNGATGGRAGGYQQPEDGAIQSSNGKGGAGPIETETGEQLFCICLGVDNGTPMIFCEACENWFHFECINLSEEDASRIATYYCDMCEQAGSGKTEWSYDAPSTFDELPSFPTAEGLPDSPARPAVPLPTPSTSSTHPVPLPPPPPVMTPSDSGEEHDNAEDGDYFSSREAEASHANKSSKSNTNKSSLSPALADSEDEEDDDEYDEQGGSASAKRKKAGTSRLPALPKGNQRRKSSSAGTSNAKRRKRVVEDEEEAEERRRKSASTSQFYGSASKPASNPSDPLSNPTRKHCIEQLEKILSTIFTTASTSAPTSSTNEDSASKTTVSPEKAREYAEAVELELFTHNSEPDAKGVLTHSKKYTAKFRTLHFNLKSNDYFKSRVASGALDAKAIYNMNQEDLLSPEVRAEQELEKAKSLAQSVKMELFDKKPKTKLTHKGEEILDEFDDNDTQSSMNNNNNNNGGIKEQDRRDSMSMITGDTPYMPNDGFEAFSDRERSTSLAGSPRLGDSPRFGSPSAVFAESPSGRAYSPVVESPQGQSTSASPDKPSSTSMQETSEQDEFVRPALPHHARSDSQSKVKLDLDAVWSNLKPAPTSTSPEKEDPSGELEESKKAKEKEEDDMDVESDNEDLSDDNKKKSDKKENDEEYDPFATDAREKSNADDDFDALMGGNEASQESSAKKESKQQPEATPSSPSSVRDEISLLPSVWEGIISLVDEGSFPARLVQVGGTPFGPHPSIWERVLPKSKIDITGRIDEKAASDYVVQSNFSQSRENIVLAILPNSSETSSNPSNPEGSKEKTEAMYAKLIAMYSDRKRYGVAPPSAELKKVTRDHYIVPLKKDAALPDYVELLDSHTLPEKGNRNMDYLLSVLVLQKGLGLNTTHRSSTSGGSTPQSSQSTQHRNQLHAPSQHAGPSHISPLSQPGIQAQAPTFSSNMSPPYQPPTIPSQAQLPTQPASGAGLPSLDPAALQSLLSNPSLLQALSAGGQQGSPPQPAGAQYGAFSPPQPNAVNSGYSASGIPGISGGVSSAVPSSMPAWGSPPVPQQQGYPPFPPPPAGIPGQWNPAGSPPWQGGQPPVGGPPAWTVPPQQQNHPPGYIDPERIKAASAEARRIAELDRQEKLRSGAGSSSFGGGGRPNRDGHRDRNDHRGGRDRGFGGDDRRSGGGRGDRHGNGRKGDGGSGSGINQMQAGIKDRGWGRRG